MFKFIKKIFGPGIDYKSLVANGAVILDVRTQGEFQSGHIRISKNIPLDQIPQQIEKIKKFNSPVICVCRSGMRSSTATSILKNNGLEVYNGGAWNSLDMKLR